MAASPFAPTRTALALVVVVAVAAGCPGSREPAWGEITPALADKFEAALLDARAEQDLPGLAMAVEFRDSGERWVSATGSSNLASQTAWQASDESRIGSVTKTFTAALVLRLVEEGVLDLEDPIERWVPGFYVGPTLAQLLAHTSGIASYNYIGAFDESAAWTPTALVQWAYDHEPTLRFTPGTQWEYSNTNYVLLGLTVEAALGIAYEEALRTWLFVPHDLDALRLAGTGDDSPTLVHAYDGPDHVDTAATTDPSFGWAAGSIVSTPERLAAWMVALYGGDVLHESTRTMMTKPSGVTDPDEEDYGFGTIIENGTEGDATYTLVGHTGGIGGYTTSAFYLEERGVALVMMSNWKQTDLRAAMSHGWAATLGVEAP